MGKILAADGLSQDRHDQATFSHPNHVFELDGEVWVTRFEQRDAICLTTSSPRTDIAAQRSHDGYLFGDRVYFTTVDGHVVIANRKTLQIEQMTSFNQVSEKTGQVLG